MELLSQNIARLLRLSPDTVVDGLAMADVDTWDSLSHMELVVGLEEIYQVNFTGDDIVEMTSVAAIRSVLTRLGKAA